jgi:tol-pal system protein YbgF
MAHVLLWSQVSVRAVALACFFVMLGSSHANAALFGDDEARKAILEMRQKIEGQRQEFELRLAKQHEKQNDEIKKLNAELKESSDQSRRSMLDLGNQIEILRLEISKIRGQEELNSRGLADTQRRMKDLSQAFDDRLGKLEPGRVNLDGREFVVESDERRDYDTALGLFRAGEFDPAEKAFINLLKRYPKTGYALPVYFWLANAQYATAEYKSAIQNFKTVLGLDAEHVRAPDAMLSIANCLSELKDSKGAKKTLEDLIKRYPKTDAASAAKERLLRLK